MANILIRSGKEPWTPISPEATLAGNVLGTNAGNSLFGTAVFSTLSVPGQNLESDYFQIERSRRPRSMVAEIDDRYDQIVIPMANAFRASFVTYLDRWSELLERSKTPATVIGVGGQFSLSEGTPTASRQVRDSTNRFMRSVLKRSASVGVRGEITYDYLRSLGYSDDEVDIIGCPSLYRPDIEVRVGKAGPELPRDARVALNVTPVMSVAKDHNDTMGHVVKLNMDRYPNLEYFP